MSNNYYARLDENSQVLETVRTDEPTSDMILCDKKVIRHDGSLYVGRLPPKGYFWDGKHFVANL